MQVTLSKYGKVLSVKAESPEDEPYSMLVGFNFLTLTAESDAAVVSRFIKTAWEAGLSSCRLHLNLHSEFAEYVCFGILSGDGQTIVVSMQEIPSADKSQQQLLDAQKRLRTLLNELPVAVVIADSGATIRAVNPVAERLFGLDAKQISKRNLFNLFDFHASNISRPDSIEEFQRLFPARSIRVVGYRQLGDRRKTFPMEVNLGLLEQAAGLYIISILDITEREENEKLKHEFIAMVSHDLKAPLSCLMAGLSLLRQVEINTASDDGQETISELELECKKLMRFIEDLLDLSRLESGRFVLELKPTSLQSVCDQAVKTVSILAAEIEVKIHVHHSPSIVLADEERLTQVLVNLLTNAIKASHAGGEVIIEHSDLQNQIEVRVRDRGCGLSDANRERVFERFFRSSDSKVREGTGLGLSICKAIVEQHNGVIGVETVLGEGATFWFRIGKAEQNAENF